MPLYPSAPRTFGPTLGGLLILSTLLVQADGARAAPIAVEAFDYPVGSTIATGSGAGLAGGSGWATPWGNNGSNDMVVVDGLAYAGLPSSGGAAYNPGFDWGSGLDRAISTTVRELVWPAAERDLWVSFLLRPDASALALADDSWAGLNVYSGDGVFIGKPGGSAGATPPPSLYALQSGDLYVPADLGPVALRTDLLVAHLQAGAPGEKGVVELWVNPTLTAPLALGAPGARRTDLTFATGGPIHINLNSSGFYVTDEVRIGTTAADVLGMPAPATAAALVPGLVVLLALRRRAHGKASGRLRSPAP